MVTPADGADRMSSSWDPRLRAPTLKAGPLHVLGEPLQVGVGSLRLLPPRSGTETSAYTARTPPAY